MVRTEPGIALRTAIIAIVMALVTGVGVVVVVVVNDRLKAGFWIKTNLESKSCLTVCKTDDLRQVNNLQISDP